MTRLSRIVAPGLPHHVTQRGNRRETVFFSDDDYQAYMVILCTAAHLAGKDDALTTVGPALSRIGDFARLLEHSYDDQQFEPLRRAEKVGRPIGSKSFLQGLKKQFNRSLQVQKRGRKKQPTKP